MKRVILILAKGFGCQRCVEGIKEIVEPAQELTFNDQVDLEKSLFT